MEFFADPIMRLMETGVVGTVAIIFLTLFLKGRKEIDKAHAAHLQDVRDSLESLNKIEQTLNIIGVENAAKLESTKDQLYNLHEQVSLISQKIHNMETNIVVIQKDLEHLTKS